MPRIEGDIDDYERKYKLSRQVSHEYFSEAFQRWADAWRQNFSAEALKPDQPSAENKGKQQQFAQDLLRQRLETIEDEELKKRPEFTKLFEQTAEEGFAETTGNLEEPLLDPVAAASGGFGGILRSSLNRGLKLLPSLGRATTAGAVSAATEYPIGAGAEALEVKAPYLALPASIAVGLISGGTLEPLIEKRIIKGAAITKAAIRNKLARGVVDDDVSEGVVQELNQMLTQTPKKFAEPAVVESFVRRNPQETAKLYSMAPGAVAGFEKDEDGTWRFDPQKAVLGIAAGYALTQFPKIGITTRTRGKRYLRGGGRLKPKEVEPLLVKNIDAKDVDPAWDQVSSVQEAVDYGNAIKWMDPEVVDDYQPLRWRKNDRGFYGNEKMRFANEAFPQGRNTWDIAGCGREKWAIENGIDVKGACYGGACYAEMVGKKYGSGSVASGEQFKTNIGEVRQGIKDLFGDEREKIIKGSQSTKWNKTLEKNPDYFDRKIKTIKKAVKGTSEALAGHKKTGSEARVIEAHEAQLASQKKSLQRAEEEFAKFKAAPKEAIDKALTKVQQAYPDYEINYLKKYDKLSIKARTEDPGRPAKVSTKIEPADGQDVRLGVDTDGSAWLSDPKVMDAILEANPRTLTVYSSAYHKPPPPHELSQRSIINVTVSGWHPLPETVARLRWAQEARANGWNVVLREVTASPKQFNLTEANLYNRLHKAIMKTDFFPFQQPLHKGATHSEPRWKLPSCCVGSKANPRTCDHCENAEGLGKGFQKFWKIGETEQEKILPAAAGYAGATEAEVLSLPRRIIKDQSGNIILRGGDEPSISKVEDVKLGSGFEHADVPADKFFEVEPEITEKISKSGEIRKFAENINLSRIESGEELAEAYGKTVSLFSQELRQAKRGYRSNAQTIKAADMLGMTPKELLKRRAGQAFSAEEVTAARFLLASSADKLTGMAKKVQSLEATDLDKFEFRKALNAHYALQAQVTGATAEAGRTLQALRIQAKSTQVRLKQIDELLEKMPGAKTEDLAAAVASMDTIEGMNTFARQVQRATTRDMFLEAWINGLLSGPQTHAVNTLSNSLAAFWQIPERYLAATFSKLPAVGSKQIRFGEANHLAYGMVEGYKDGLKAAWKAFKSGESSDIGGKIETQRRAAISAQNVAQLPVVKKLSPEGFLQGGVMAQAVDGLGEVVRLPGRALTAEDELFKAVGYRMELRAQALRMAKDEGLKGRAMAERMQQIMNDPQAHAPDVHLAAQNAARYQTFTQQIENSIVRAIGKSNNPVIRMIFPFVSTPTNILKFTFDRTPLAPLSARIRADIRAGGPQRDLAVARIAMGFMTMAALAVMAAEGKITGGGPSDPKLRQYKYNTGWQPYSIQVGDKYYSYGRLEPLGMLFGLAADYHEISGELSEEDRRSTAAMLVTALSKNVMSKTWLRGMSEIVTALDDPDRYGQKWWTRFAGSFVPAGVAQIERVVDPQMEYVRDALGQIRSRIPGLSKDMPKRRNIWGEPIQLEGGLGPDIVSPIYTSTKKSSPIDEEILKLRIPFSMPRKVQQLEGVPVELNEREYERFLVLMNETKLSSGKPLKATLDHLVTRDRGYKNAPNTDIKEMMIKQYMTEARALARERLLEEFGYLRDIIAAVQAEGQTQ